MKKKLAVMAAFALTTTAAWAGLYQPAPIVVDLVSQFAQGDMRTAANSKNEVEFIGCGSRTISDGAGGAFKFGFCQAGDEAGNQVTCFSQEPALLNAMRSTADFSYITFAWTDDGQGNLTCTRIGHSTQSFYLGKTK
jgi:hypothetical protein